MPRKNKKIKATNETKTNSNVNKNENFNAIQMAPKAEEKVVLSDASNEPEKKSFCLPFDKKLKVQLRRQKKKDKKKVSTKNETEALVVVESTAENKTKIIEKDVPVQVTDLEDAELQLNGGEIKNTEFNSKGMDNDVNKNNNDTNSTIIIVHQSADRENFSEETNAINQVQTIPEDLFEEFIENEEMLHVKENVKAFQRTLPLQSPKSRQKQTEGEALAVNKNSISSKVFYNYQGVSCMASNERSFIAEQESSTEFQSDQDTCQNRKLDVIQEESSDISDTSGHSDKNRKPVTVRGNSSKIADSNVFMSCPSADAPPIYENMYNMHRVCEQIKEEESNSEAGIDDPKHATTETSVVSNVDLTANSSDGVLETNLNDSSIGISDDVHIIVDDQNCEIDKTEGDSSNLNKDLTDQQEKSTWSMKSISSTSTKLLEETGSWRSSFEPEELDGSEADVESELDSQRACLIFDTCSDDLNFKMCDLQPSDLEHGVEIFIRNYKNRNSFDRDTLGSECFLEPSLNSITCMESNELSSDIDQDRNSLPISDEKALKQVLPFLGKGMNTNHSSSNDFMSTDDDKKVYPMSVKNRIEIMKNDIDKILLSKLKVIQSLDECTLSEATWASVLENTKNQLEKRNLQGNFKNPKLVSDSSSYENVVKPEKISPSIQSKVNAKNPEALSNLAEKKILTLPYGKLVLKKIGLGKCCSKEICSESNKDIEEDMYMKSNKKQNEQSFGLGSENSDVSLRSVPVGIWNRVKNCEDSEFGDSRSYIEFDYADSRIGQTEKWYGTRTKDPALLLGLSPSQKKAYEERSNRFMGNEAEAASLIDLHQKFIERRSYNEPNLYNSYKCLNARLKGKHDSIVITGINVPDSVSPASMAEHKNPFVTEKVNGRRIATETMQSSNIGFSPISTKTRLVGNEKSKSKDFLSKMNGYENGDGEKERNNLKSGEEKKVKETVWTNEESDEVVGNSCLLAILQNAISDNFVPELNKDSSIESTSKSHEVSSAHEIVESMLNSWQYNPIFRYTSSKIEHIGETGNLCEEGRQNFERIWSKEKNITTGEKRFDGKYRPKTICCETESELYANESCEPIIEKKVATIKRAPINKMKVGDNEKLIITANLPAVSDVIKSFEEPPSSKPLLPGPFEDNGLRRQVQIDNEKYSISKRGDIAFLQNGSGDAKRKVRVENRKSMPASLLSEKETFNQLMYNEYMFKLAERLERRQKKLIKVSQSNEFEGPDAELTKYLNEIEDEFIKKVKERRQKLTRDTKEENNNNILDSLEKKCQEFSDYWKGETSSLENGKVTLDEIRDGSLGKGKEGGGTETSSSKRSSIQLISDTTSDVDNLPRHLKELLQVEKEDFPDIPNERQRTKPNILKPSRVKHRKINLLKEIDDNLVLSKGFLLRKGVWSPLHKVSVEKTDTKEENKERKKLEDEPIPPVWTPKSAQASPVLEKKEFRPVNFESPILSRKKYVQEEKRESSVPPPWRQPGGDKLPELAKSPSSPALSLPKAPNPTVTLLQKAREGHLPRGAHYLNTKMNEVPGTDGSLIERLEIVSSAKTESGQPKKVEVTPKKVIGIGPTTKEGIPLVLRSEISGEENREKWYKRMYDSLHKAGSDDDYVTVKYRTSPSRKGLYSSQGYHYGSGSGYQSEPESINYDLSSNKYVTLDRRRAEKTKETIPETISQSKPRVLSPERVQYFPSYKNQPGRIEDYEPGRSSISDLEVNKLWDEVLEIFDREEERSRPVRGKDPSPRSFTNYASGYISDPQYVYKRNEDEVQSPVSSEEQKEAYKIIQKGGEIPLKGLRKPAPERPKDDLDAEIEYFPLSSTLTRVRVHKQNITPLNEFPFYLNPFLYQKTTLNYPPLPCVGVCSSFSQVQIFPAFSPLPQSSDRGSSLANLESVPVDTKPTGQGQKFSVQLQNISDPTDYVQILPTPRSGRNKAPIYANLPLCERSCSPILSDIKEEESSNSVHFTQNISSDQEKKELTKRPTKKVGFTTFSDLKRVAPSALSTSSYIPFEKTKKVKVDDTITILRVKPKSPQTTRKAESLTVKVDERKFKSHQLVVESSAKPTSKTIKLEETSSSCGLNKTEKKVRKVVKKSKYPLSESFHREKPLAKANKRVKTSQKKLIKKEIEINKLPTGNSQTARLKNSKGIPLEKAKPSTNPKSVSFDVLEEVDLENNKENETVKMSQVFESVDEKPKADVDMTEVFRSRSFSPEVRRKIFKFPDMNKPVTSNKKSSKASPTLKMWTKMKVSYPGHKSRFDEFGSNIKFLQDKIKRKLKDVKDVKPEFGDDVETVRTVKKSKNGEMSIKTDRYIRLCRPPSGLLSVRSTYPVIDRRRTLTEAKKRHGSFDALKPLKASEASIINKPVTLSVRKISPKGSETRSSGTWSRGNSLKSETLERKSLHVSAAISSKEKEPAKKVMDVSALRKSVVSAKSMSPPCSSISSYRSETSDKCNLSDKSTTVSPARVISPQTRTFSPASSTSRLSSPTQSISPRSSARIKLQKYGSDSKLATKQVTSTRIITKASSQESNIGKSVVKLKEITTKIPSLRTTSRKNVTSKTNLEKKVIHHKEVEVESHEQKEGKEKPKNLVFKKPQEIVFKVHNADDEENEITKGRDLVRTDSFFQNLFLRGPIDRKPTLEIEKISSVLERARMYQRRINLTDTYKSEPSLSLITFYLNQKRPVSYSKFKKYDQDLNSPRSRSPLGSLHSENFQMKLRRFDSVSQFDESLYRDLSPDGKGRSSSEPPLRRSATNSPEDEKISRISQSEFSSIRSSPNSSRSPSCRRIKNYRASSRSVECQRGSGKQASWTLSTEELEEKNKSCLHRDLARSTSSLNLSNVSDHTEYQAYLLELMHSTRKCERFRELHKFYSNLERMGHLEKTASTGDLRPRLRNEEIIDFDRWKKVRTKERAEAELKTLVDNLMKVQKEKDLLFRASDVDAVRWKGDRGLRIKERSVEDLKDHFDRCALEEAGGERWRKDVNVSKDNYKSLWKGSSISDLASNLNTVLASHRGRPITVEELERIEMTKSKIEKEYGFSLKARSGLSSDQMNVLKDQLNEIYLQDSRRKRISTRSDDMLEKYEIVVPNESDVKSPGESALHVRCSSALSKSQTFTPTVKRKEIMKKNWMKAESIGALPTLKTSDDDIFLSSHSPKEESSFSKLSRSHSETRFSKESFRPIMRSKSSRPLSEDEKKRLSMSLSKEVIEKMATKSPGKTTVLPRETMGALVTANTKIKDKSCSPPACQEEKYIEINREEFKSSREDVSNFKKGYLASELESGSGSSEASTKTVIRKNSVDVLKKVQYFEDLRENQKNAIDIECKYEEKLLSEEEHDECHKYSSSEVKDKKIEQVLHIKRNKERKRGTLMPSSSLENLNEYFGRHKQYATSLSSSKSTFLALPAKMEDSSPTKNVFDENRWLPVRYSSVSPVTFRRVSGRGSSDSLFSYRSRSVSPDPTKYYRAYLKMVKCGAVRKLCNKFESWEDLLSLSSDKDFWLPPAPRRFASDPELTRDLLRRFGTDPTKVTIKGQEVGDVKWLKTKFEKDSNPGRGRTRFRRARSPLVRSPITATDRYMPRINVISKKAELQLQGVSPDRGQRSKTSPPPPKFHKLPASLEEYKSLIDYTKDHGGYYYTGEVEKLKRKFERLQEAERLSILGQMYTSTPNVNELRDIAPYLECCWVAHRYPGGSRSPEPAVKKREPTKVQTKPRPRSSSPVGTKQLSSILKQPCPPSGRSVFADQNFDPSIHRPKYRYQPEREVDRRCKRDESDLWRQWSKPTVTFKELVSFNFDPEIPDLSPGPESPRKYVESEVTIHYKSPVRSEAKVMLSDDELARRQAESMKRIYKEERRRKYLQELQDMNSRRHTDNFTPSQKSPIPLNRYDDFPVECNMYCATKGKDYTVDPVLVARGLYDFVGRRPRELAFRRGDIIFIVRRLDKNWCEGELNGVVGLFPLSYVEVIPYNEINMRFGRAMAKYDFVPQIPLELAARKGDMITLLRKIDENWFEGRIGDRTGIIPASYCHILAVPQASRSTLRTEKVTQKPVAAPAAHSLIHNGSGLSSKHYYTPYLSSPTSPGRSTVSSASANYHDSLSADMLIDEALMQLDEELNSKRSSSKTSASQPLNVHVNARPEPALYQVLFNHVPNNDDELELIQGETVAVVEKCGDGWYIGSKTSDGKLGIFPGTHVRRIASEFV